MEFVPVAALTALIIAVVNFVKSVKAGNVNGWLTQLVVWVTGVALMLLAGETDFAGSIPVTPELTLADVNAWSKVLAGLAFGASATVVNEFKQALDSSDSAGKPDLVEKH